MQEYNIPLKIAERFQPCRLPEEQWAEDMLSAAIAKPNPRRGCCLWAKRALDLVVAVSGIFVLSPFLFIIGMVIKLDSKGPIIYKQKRCGLNGRTFRIYKFRTMCNDAEKHTGPVWAGHSDSRVTRIGKYMRLLHIDEIPQLVNVLKGEMSLVGPRPERPEFVYSLHNVVPNYESRLAVKPGITGWAQIRNHYDTTIRDVKRKVRYDIFYIRNMCLAVDVKVIVQTVFVIIMGNSKDLAH